MLKQMKRFFVKQKIKGHRNVQIGHVEVHGGILENLQMKLNEWDIQGARSLLSYIQKATELESDATYQFRLDEHQNVEIFFKKPVAEGENIFRGVMNVRLVDDIPSSMDAKHYVQECLEKNQSIRVKIHDMTVKIDGEMKTMITSRSPIDEELIPIDFFTKESLTIPHRKFLQSHVFELFPASVGNSVAVVITHDEYATGIELSLTIKQLKKEDGYLFLQFTNADIHSPFVMNLILKVEDTDANPRLNVDTFLLDVKKDVPQRSAYKAQVANLLQAVHEQGTFYIMDKEDSEIFFSSEMTYRDESHKEGIIREYQLKKDVWKKIHQCEKILKRSFDVPAHIKMKDIRALYAIHRMLTSGRILTDFSDVSIEVTELDVIKEIVLDNADISFIITYEGSVHNLFGETIDIGETVVIFPPVSVKNPERVAKLIGKQHDSSVMNIEFVPKKYTYQHVIFPEYYKVPLKDKDKVIEAELDILAKELSTV